jgi:anti-sigma regulatory factor (Ser/Thr protein kinase)
MQEASRAAQQEIAREFTLSGDANSITRAREAVMGFVKPYLASELEEIDVLIALQEALANAVLHGCQNDASKTIHCSAVIDRSAFTITIRDSGPGFDVEAAMQSSAAGDNLTEHGRGICLMLSVMDEVWYGSGGSEVRLRKLRSTSGER